MSQTVPRRTRRSLHTIDLNPPDYKVPAGWNLVDDYIEKEVKVLHCIVTHISETTVICLYFFLFWRGGGPEIIVKFCREILF